MQLEESIRLDVSMILYCIKKEENTNTDLRE